MKKLYLLHLLLLIVSISMTAQSAMLSGEIRDEGGEPLIGASVYNKATQSGVVSDIDGSFEISVSNSDVIEISFVGYESQSITYSGQSNVDIVLSSGKLLNEVVVTGMGLSREKKALGYSVQKLESSELLENGDQNLINSLQGRVAGVQINASSGAPGAGASIIIRGLTSLNVNGNNQPLIVIDGIPISNETFAGNQLPSAGSNSPGSNEQASFTNRLADINPNDIESLNVLKGPGATALYGLRGANGVIEITTKKGQDGLVQVNYSASAGISELGKRPEYVDDYREGRFGRLRFYNSGAPLRFQGFGPKVYPGLTPVFDVLDDFYVTGNDQSHNLSITGGNSKAQYITSIGYSKSSGIIPNSDWSRISLRLGGNLDVSDKFSINGTVNYSNSGGNKPHSGDKSILSALSYTPTSFDVNDFENPDGSQKDYSDGIIDNPRYLAEYSTLEDDVNRVNGNIGFRYAPLDWLELNFKIGGDVYSDVRIRQVPAGLDVSSQTGGFLINEAINFKEVNTVFTAVATHDLTEDIGITATLGHNMYANQSDIVNARGERFTLPNFYDFSNTENLFTTQSNRQQRVIGAFGILSFDYKDFLYLDITGRNDWSSTLPKENRSFFYPSVSASWVFSENISAPFLSYGKLRASWAKVAKDASPGLIGQTYAQAGNFPFNGVNGFNLGSTVGDANLRPETTTGVEIGVEARLLNNRVGFEVTAYQQISKDQILNVPVSNTSGYSRYITNAGEIKNQGIELLIEGSPIRTQNFEWNVGLNWSKNQGTVVEIAEGIDEITFASNRITNKLVPGGKVGDLYGYTFNRDDAGNLLIGSNGFPSVNFDFDLVGNALPDFIAGLTNSFKYKNLRLSALLEWRKGGDLYDVGERNGIRNGVLGFTERRYEQVVFSGVTSGGEVNTQPVEITGETLWRSSNWNNASELLLQDGSWVRLRNINLTYTLPKALLEKVFIQGASLTLSGNNLFLNTPFRGFDPETNYYGSGSNIYGYTGLQTPATKSYRATLNLTF